MKLRVARAWPAAEGVRALELISAEADLAGAELPAFTAGAHLEFSFATAAGPLERRYSVCSDPADRMRYRIAVLREPNSRGGSSHVHDVIQAGDELTATGPRNEFQLDESAEHTVLIAGGIGVTPIVAMAHRLRAIGRSFEVHYAARHRRRMAYVDELEQLAGRQLYLAAADAGQRLNLAAVLGEPTARRHAYVCGPQRLIAATRYTARQLGWNNDHVHLESFGPVVREADRPLRVELRLSGMTVDVPVGRTILDALLEAGVFAPFECKRGECGSCSVNVVGGKPDHRDVCLTPVQQQTLMCTCISWATSDSLVLDL